MCFTGRRSVRSPNSTIDFSGLFPVKLNFRRANSALNSYSFGGQRPPAPGRCGYYNDSRNDRVQHVSVIRPTLKHRRRTVDVNRLRWRTVSGKWWMSLMNARSIPARSRRGGSIFERGINQIETACLLILLARINCWYLPEITRPVFISTNIPARGQ